MKLTRCPNGHFYDSELFGECPHCNPNAAKAGDQPNEAAQKPAEAPAPQNDVNPAPQHAEEPAKKSEQIKAVAPDGVENVTPAVGWLVAIEGKHFGEDFKLKSGTNFIGRARTMDVQLSQDTFVSREKHGVLVYDSKSNTYTVQPGASVNPFFHNDKPVSASEEIKSGDTIALGNTKLLFIACCSDRFIWGD